MTREQLQRGAFERLLAKQSAALAEMGYMELDSCANCLHSDDMSCEGGPEYECSLAVGDPRVAPHGKCGKWEAEQP